ncbi:MAG: hypothetical protein AB1Z23_06480 [Eubacteriales bacterium]
MTSNKLNYQDKLFIFTVLFFAIGFLHISFAVLGLICFITPFVLFWIYDDKIWCKFFCPRAGFFNRVLSKISLKKPMPKWLTGQTIKKIVLTYFGINLFFITMSTIMVSIDKIAPVDQIRFMIMFPLPINMPQILNLSVPAPLLHLGYRVYSVMFSSTIIGLILGFIYSPRTWCIICPIQTLTTKEKQPTRASS